MKRWFLKDKIAGIFAVGRTKEPFFCDLDGVVRDHD